MATATATVTSVSAEIATAARKAARGSEQKWFVEELLAGREPHSFAYGLRGTATRYLASYRRSFYTLLERLEAAGVKVQAIPGPRGGMTSATYRLA